MSDEGDHADGLGRAQDLDADIFSIIKANPSATPEQIVNAICFATSSKRATVERRVKVIIETSRDIIAGNIIIPKNLKTRGLLAGEDMTSRSHHIKNNNKNLLSPPKEEEE